MTTLCPKRQNVERFRGDTTPIRVELVDGDCNPVTESISGATFVMTCHEEEWPDTNPPIFTINGTDLDDIAKTITFEFTATEADNRGAHYYDVKMTESGGIKHTVVKGLMLFEENVGD